MIRVNGNYRKLNASYLFADIARRVAKFQEEHPEIEVIKLGIGDVTRCLPPTVIDAFHSGVNDMAGDATFKGYGPDRGYEFLQSKIAEAEFQSRGCQVQADEIFISDGAKCDTANFQELFAQDTFVAVPDPVYPVYVDTNVMAGRTGEWKNGRYDGLMYLESTTENGFVPAPPSQSVDLVYLCFPNNPTGAVATASQLAQWVDYAHKHGALILFDAAYERFIRDNSIPHSIFEVSGATEVAVEFRSFSKTAGFTGTRCAYTVVPRAARARDEKNGEHQIWDLWNRRQATKFNGVSYPVQIAAAAIYSESGEKEVTEIADYYLENARLIRDTMVQLGYNCTGGTNSPYIWVETGTDSWEFFDRMLHGVGVVITPGAGFGKCGEGFVRISAFNDRARVGEALERIRGLLAEG